MCGTVFQLKSFFYGYSLCLLRQVAEDRVFVCVLRVRLNNEQVSVGEKFCLFLQQVVSGDAPILKMIASIPITSVRLRPYT
jgi:hypothetical protein